MRYAVKPEGDNALDDVLGLGKMRKQIEIMNTDLGKGIGQSSVAEEAYRSLLQSAARTSVLLERLAKKRDGETRR